MLECRTLPELRVVHALVWRSPTPTPFLDRHPQVLRSHPILSQPFSDLWIGVVLEERPVVSTEFFDCTSGTSRHWQQPSDAIQLFVGFPKMSVDAGRIQD